MFCDRIKPQLGPFLDNELSASDRRAVEDHLEVCSSCRAELDELRELAAAIAQSERAVVPAEVWINVRQRLDDAEPGTLPQLASRRWQFRRAPWAIAAGVILAVGLGLIGLVSYDTPVRASTVDFGVLLDALPLDAQKAFRKFLIRYDAKPTTPAAAQRLAPELNFATPETLPGGFRLHSVYELRIGGSRGIAASYDNDGEFLAVVFHPPMRHEKFGSHKNYPCVIGDQCGHKVQVGDWKLVHLTDPTTCHCLLSRLDETTELPAVMAAIAPTLPESASGHDHP